MRAATTWRGGSFAGYRAKAAARYAACGEAIRMLATRDWSGCSVADIGGCWRPHQSAPWPGWAGAAMRGQLGDSTIGQSPDGRRPNTGAATARGITERARGAPPAGPRGEQRASERRVLEYTLHVLNLMKLFDGLPLRGGRDGETRGTEEDSACTV